MPFYSGKFTPLMDRLGPWASDFGTAFGSFDLSGKGSFMITTDGKGGYTVAGDIKYTFSDNYRWDSRRGDSGDEELVDHSKMNSLQSLGAKNFYIRCIIYKECLVQMVL
ncbi:hypothetical protein [Chitinophaga sp. Ak27]|uniref:hypothetical protein n=1 Tax=Chitinophaga sp. Ak27 TaxID=2726116 RepID=UPI00145ED87B|nr:hypothetical protein [Chitinophaga sp. Ak27]NLU92759.1 hypothetical protein [Chitinophaga sp. Ak27]